MEKVLWLTERVKSGLLEKHFLKLPKEEVSCWWFPAGQCSTVRQTTRSWQWSNQDINWAQSILYHAGDSWGTQNIQINEVIGENENVHSIYIYIFYRKKTYRLFGQPKTFLPFKPPGVWCSVMAARANFCKGGNLRPAGPVKPKPSEGKWRPQTPRRSLRLLPEYEAPSGVCMGFAYVPRVLRTRRQKYLRSSRSHTLVTQLQVCLIEPTIFLWKL